MCTRASNIMFGLAHQMETRSLLRHSRTSRSTQVDNLLGTDRTVDFDTNVEYWQQDNLLKPITLENNEIKAVTNSRDTQELEQKAKQQPTHKQLSEENSTEDEKRNLPLLIRLIRNLLQLLKLPVMSRLMRMDLFLN
ncbi:Uncharacterized protein Rs2_03240 [Raphanus sativus]|nr:Uncharacterized protein Rs2_03240 [Raphanus sativus]